MRNYKAVIFDLDGTLLDSLIDLANSANRILEKHNLPVHPVERYKNFIGDGTLKLVERFLPEQERTAEKIQAIVPEFKSDYSETCDLYSKPFDGISEMLEKLKQKNIKTAILSNKPHELTLRCTNKLLPTELFDIIRGHIEDVPRKPDPQSALQLIQELGVSREETVFVGDMEMDINTALNAGFKAVGVDWGFRTKEELLNLGAEVVISRPGQLFEILEEQTV